MLVTPTLDRLHALGLSGMARALGEQMESAQYHQLAFEDRLGLLIDREAQDRSNRRLERNLKSARPRVTAACIEDIDFHTPRGLDRSVVLGLAAAQWVERHQNLLIVGPTGAGKTYLACALAQAAVRIGHTALYLRAPRMFDDLAVAHGDGRFARLVAAWARIDVLIDDLALRPLSAEQAADLLEVIEDRSQRPSTIVTSQLPVPHWHEALGDPTLADAILDSLTHNAHRLELRGESLRRGRPGEAQMPPDAAETAPRAAEPTPRRAAAGKRDAVRA